VHGFHVRRPRLELRHVKRADPAPERRSVEPAELDADVVSGTHSGLLTFQFHYRVPAAKNKPNTNCTAAGDPNHNTACQGKWSTTASI